MLYSFQKFVLNEKSSLIGLGVPKQVMKHIQQDYALSPTVEWIKINLKKDIKDILIQNKNNLFLQIGDNDVKVIVTVFEQNNKLYYIDKYIRKTGDWGDEWIKLDREGATLSSLLVEIDMENKHYLLKGAFSIIKSDIRQTIKQEKEFDIFNKKFKEDFLDYFTNVLKKSYSIQSKKIEKTIIDNLASVNPDLNADDIKKILYKNSENAKKTKNFKDKSQNIDNYDLNNPDTQYNSLSIFDEYLIQFEEDYSKKYHKYYNIQTLVEEYSRSKIFTAFIYYLYTGFLMDLNSYKTVSVLDDFIEFEDILNNDF